MLFLFSVSLLCHLTVTARRFGIFCFLVSVKAWAVSQYVDTSKNVKACAVSQHFDSSKNARASAVTQHCDISKNAKA